MKYFKVIQGLRVTCIIILAVMMGRTFVAIFTGPIDFFFFKLSEVYHSKAFTNRYKVEKSELHFEWWNISRPVMHPVRGLILRRNEIFVAAGKLGTEALHLYEKMQYLILW